MMLEKFGTQAMEIAFVAVLVYLVLSNAGAFSQITAAVGNVYTSSIKALQAR